MLLPFQERKMLQKNLQRSVFAVAQPVHKLLFKAQGTTALESPPPRKIYPTRQINTSFSCTCGRLLNKKAPNTILFILWYYGDDKKTN